jgi:hypothetical protein
MADPVELRLELTTARRGVDGTRLGLHDARATVKELELSLQTALEGTEEEIKAQIEAAKVEVESWIAQHDEAIVDFNVALDAYDSAVAAEPPLWSDGGDVPLLLLPVRLEAVHSRLANAAELLLRVYPDDVHVDAHEEQLTPAERDAGTEYWRDADADPDGAWARLLARLGPARAAWTREALRPGAADPGSREASWTRAAHTTMLPDHFVFSAYVDPDGNGESLELAWREPGKPIKDLLALGFPPPGFEVERMEGLPWDEASRWLVDFETAREQGMALRVPLEDPDVTYALLTVVGVSAALDADAAATRWDAALVAHQYGNGLGFLPTGTPTNNTPASRSGWRSRPEVPPPAVLDAQRDAYDEHGASAAARAARAFGIDGRHVLAAVPGAQDDSDAAALGALHRAFGRLLNLSPLVRPFPPVPPPEGPDDPGLSGPRDDTVLPPEIPAVIAHFDEHVRARGTLPTLRIGRQPYGLLPASALDLWRGTETDPRLHEHLRGLLWILEISRTRAPQVGAGDDQDAVILDLLSRLPVSRRLRSTQQRPIDAREAQIRVPVPAVLPTIPDGSRADFFSVRERMERSEPDERGWLDGVSPPRGVEEQPADPDLLAALDGRPLEQMLAVGDALAQALRDDPQADTDALDTQFREFGFSLAALIDNGWPPGYYAIASRALGEYYSSVGLAARAPTDPDMDDQDRAFFPEVARRWREIAAALVELEPRARADLPGIDRLLLEVLDAVSHRADAWYTSLAAARLARLRDERPTGLHTGAYGWLAEVHDPGPLGPGDGYVMAPSIQHAVTAAVLRSGFNAHADKRALAVDLQSWRVRAALELVDGVRTGQPLAVLLGYRFERGLHDAQLDAFIDGFRRAYPLTISVDASPPDPEAAATSLEARNVVDGQKLRRHEIAEGVADPRAAADEDAGAVIDRLIAELDEAVDGVADLMLAESVHHLVGGNPLRAGLSADAIGRGDGLPMELEVVRTPRSAEVVTHHVGLLARAAPEIEGWSDQRPLARLDPALEGWCRRRLGAAGEWRFALDGDAPGVSLAALGWCALDVLGAATGEGSPLETALAARGNAPLAQEDGRLAELTALCGQLRGLLAGAAPLLPSHLDPAADGWARVDVGELHDRLARWRTDVETARAALAEAVQADGPDPERAVKALADLAEQGILRAHRAPDGDAIAQGSAVLAAMAAGEAAPLAPPPDDRSEAPAWAGAATAAVRALAGDHLQLTLALDVAAPAADRTPSGAEPDAVEDWLRDVARVRPAVDALRRALVAGRVLGGGLDGAFAVTQSPFADAARWAALAPAQPDPRDPPDPDRPPVSATIVLHHDGDPSAEPGTAGLVVDAFAEAVPRATAAGTPQEVAAVAFHHDRPGARAPQALLLAVPPDPVRGWRAEDVHGVVDDVFKLAQIRTLDLRDVPELATIFPVPTPW